MTLNQAVFVLACLTIAAITTTAAATTIRHHTYTITGLCLTFGIALAIIPVLLVATAH